jgi:hypothetical protein
MRLRTSMARLASKPNASLPVSLADKTRNARAIVT